MAFHRFYGFFMSLTALYSYVYFPLRPYVGEVLLNGKAQYGDLLVLTILDQFLFILKIFMAVKMTGFDTGGNRKQSLLLTETLLHVAVKANKGLEISVD